MAGTKRGRTQDQMVQRREAAGPELDMLARIMSDPNPNAEEATTYMLGLMKAGQVPAQDAIQLLQSMPKDPDALRTWARSMFSLVMHIGAHTHAAFPREQFPAPQPVAPAMPEAPEANGEGEGTGP